MASDLGMLSAPSKGVHTGGVVGLVAEAFTLQFMSSVQDWYGIHSVQEF